MRRFGWAGSAPVLDPLPRWLRADVLSTGDLNIAGTTVAGEGSRARRIEQALLDGADPATLAEAGVGWVVIENSTPGALGAAPRSLGTLEPAYSDADLTLYRVGGDLPSAPGSHRAIVLAAHLVWAAMVLGGALSALGLARGRAGAGSRREGGPPAAG
jgi:hypothetical protein